MNDREGCRRRQPQPWNLDRARRFVMPIGKYRGYAMSEILRADPGYVQWVAATPALSCRNAPKAAKLLLANRFGSDPITDSMKLATENSKVLCSRESPARDISDESKEPSP
jgi:hypothetical protein